MPKCKKAPAGAFLLALHDALLRRPPMHFYSGVDRQGVGGVIVVSALGLRPRGVDEAIRAPCKAGVGVAGCVNHRAHRDRAQIASRRVCARF